MRPSTFVQSHRPSRSTSHSVSVSVSVSYSDDSLYPSLVSFSFLSSLHARNSSTSYNSPSYILPGCQHLVLECLHPPPPKGLCMAPGRYVLLPTLHSSPLHPL